MANASRYEFNCEEIATALLRHVGINDGFWTIVANFPFVEKHINIDGALPRLGFVCSPCNASLMHHIQSVPGLTVDTTPVNPRLTASTESRRRTH